MTLSFEDEWVWDSWIADTGHEYHLFFLRAPRSLDDQTQRHFNAAVGHAVSYDLWTWEDVGTVLEAGPAGSFEDLAIWTGSIIEHDRRWYMFYTATQRADCGAEQRIALATSDDLASWTRHPDNPIIEYDPRWYERVEYEAWRDPWVMRDPEGDGFHALITARATHGPEDGRGIIGHAWSPDLVSWEVRPPLTEPGEFGHMEVPQAEIVDGTPVLLFSVGPDRFGAARQTSVGDEEAGTFVAVGESLLGPWDIAGAQRIPVPDLYAARLVPDRAGEWQVLGFIDGAARGAFVGAIIDPVPFQDLDLI